MKEFIENLISRLEELKKKDCTIYSGDDFVVQNTKNLVRFSYDNAIAIVNQLAEEYINCSTDTSTNTSSGWIHCSQPPEIIKYDDDKTGVVILQNKYGEINIGTYKQGSFHSMYKKDHNYLIKDDSIVYWQPFPKPITISNTWKQQIMDRFERME